MPDVFGLEGITIEDAGDQVVGEIAGDGELAAVEGGVTEAVETFVGFDFERDEVAAGGADVDGRVANLHGFDFPAGAGVSTRA